MYIWILVIMIFSSPAWAQHSGHEPARSQPNQARQMQAGPVLPVRDAIKASQAQFRDLEKAARAADEASFADLASRLEASIEDLTRSVDAAQDGNSYQKDLDLAQRSLSRQLLQIQQLAGTAPPAAAEWLAHLEDDVILARDNILAQQESIRTASANNEGNHHGSANHGCGSRRPGFLQ
jgi:hypothetical protein